MRKHICIWIAPVLFGFSSCSFYTTITCEDPSAKIYVDEDLEGQGAVEIWRFGLPATKEVEARHDNRVLAQASISRKFTYHTLVFGLFSYYTGFVWGWAFPEEVYLPVGREGPGHNKENPWTKPDIKEPSPWGRPPGNW